MNRKHIFHIHLVVICVLLGPAVGWCQEGEVGETGEGGDVSTTIPYGHPDHPLPGAVPGPSSQTNPQPLQPDVVPGGEGLDTEATQQDPRALQQETGALPNDPPRQTEPAAPQTPDRPDGLARWFFGSSEAPSGAVPGGGGPGGTGPGSSGDAAPLGPSTGTPGPRQALIESLPTDLGNF